MGLEIERKFLALEKFEEKLKPYFIGKRDLVQAYLGCGDLERRVRRMKDLDKNTIVYHATTKNKNTSLIRNEYQTEITKKQFDNYLSSDNDAKIVVKTRYLYLFESLLWKIDVIVYPSIFPDGSKLRPLVEVEIPVPDYELELLDLSLQEVTGNPVYYNANIAQPIKTKEMLNAILYW